MFNIQTKEQILEALNKMSAKDKQRAYELIVDAYANTDSPEALADKIIGVFNWCSIWFAE